MTVYTRSDLVHEALRNIGFLPEGTVAGPEEYATVDRKIDQMISYLEAMDIVDLSEPGELGDPNSGIFSSEYFHSLGAILANMVKAQFGAAGDQALQAEATKAEGDLYVIEAAPYTRKITEGQYF